jgi:hypothetical protein
MSKYRTGHDAPEPRKPKFVKPGELPPGRIPIIDGNTGARRGHVGKLASEATVSRFGVHNAKLDKRNGKPAWIGEGHAFNQRRAELRLAQQRTIAKGSVTRTPTKPALARRPERGG